MATNPPVPSQDDEIEVPTVEEVVAKILENKEFTTKLLSKLEERQSKFEDKVSRQVQDLDVTVKEHKASIKDALNEVANLRNLVNKMQTAFQGVMEKLKELGIRPPVSQNEKDQGFGFFRKKGN